MQFVQQEQLIVSGDRLVIACSGGVDSMALLSFCLQLKNVELVIAHVDHMLRGQQSYEDYLFVEEVCRQNSLTFEGARIDIPSLYEQQGGNLQALCREQRYKFLTQVMIKYDAQKLLTAHHADDQLESMLMALVKSTSATALQGINVRRIFTVGEIIRPFLMVTKAEIRGYLQKTAFTYREDASNEKDSYMRNRIRHHVVPLLEAENSQVSKHAVQMALQIAEDDHYLQQQALQLFPKIIQKGINDTYQFEIDAFQSVAVTLQRRLILILLNYIYSDTNTFQSYTLCTAILDMVQSREGSAEIHLPQEVIARRQYDMLVVGKLNSQQSKKSVHEELKLNEWQQFGRVRVYIGDSSNVPTPHENATLYYFSKASVLFPLRVRVRQQGDKLHCLGMMLPKKISRILIDEKIPLHARDDWPILVDNNNEILALLGIRVSPIFSKRKRANDDYILVAERLL